MDKDKNLIESLKFQPIQKLTAENLTIPEVFKSAIRNVSNQGEIKHLLKYSSIEFLEPHIWNMVKDELISIEDIPKIFLEDYDIAVCYAKQDYCNMVMLPSYFKNDKEFIHEVAFSNGQILAYASEKVKQDENILNQALKNNVKCFKYFPNNFKTKENCIKAITNNFYDSSHAYNWQCIPEKLSLNEDFIKECGKLCSEIYQYLNPFIRDKYEISEYFLSINGSNLKYASEENKNNINLVQKALEKKYVPLSYIGNKLKNDSEFVFSIIKKNPIEIHYCGESIKNNVEIAKYICNIKLIEPAISFFNEEIKSNISIAMMSILKDSKSINCISKNLMNNKNFICLYIEQQEFNPMAFHYLSKEIRNDVDIMIKAYDRNSDSLKYIGNKLKHNSEFLNHIFSSINQNKKVNKNILLTNLKTLSFETGNEKELLIFCDSSKLNIDDIQNKDDILKQIKDIEFVNMLKKQTNIYKYLKANSIMKMLSESLPKKNNEFNSKKIKKLKI